MIPPKVILEGDKIKAEKLRGFALSQLEILKNTMKLEIFKKEKIGLIKLLVKLLKI